MSCPLSFYFRKAGAERQQSSALTFGTLIHDAILHLEVGGDLDATLDKWLTEWAAPEDVSPDLLITEWIKGQDYAKLRDQGTKILERWREMARWNTETVLAREHHFVVPIGNHELEGTVDKLVVKWIDGEYALLVRDYKTSRKKPTYNYLAHDIQFTAYAYATRHRAFWNGLSPTAAGDQALFEQWGSARVYGEWIHLQDTKRLEAGERTEVHFNRLRYAVDQMAKSIGLEIYVPTISGESCAYCDFRAVCGLNPDYRT